MVNEKELKMASIFSGTEPPQWLQQRAESDLASNTKSTGELAGMVGTSFAAAINLATDPPDHSDMLAKGQQPGLGTRVKDFNDAYQRARMTQQNPLWFLEAQQQRQQIMSNAANMQAKALGLKEQADEHAQELEDAKVAVPWLSHPDWNKAPEVKSKKWLQEIDKARTNHTAEEHWKTFGEAALERVRIEGERAAFQNDQKQAQLEWDKQKLQKTIEEKDALAKAERESKEKIAAENMALKKADEDRKKAQDQQRKDAIQLKGYADREKTLSRVLNDISKTEEYFMARNAKTPTAAQKALLDRYEKNVKDLAEVQKNGKALQDKLSGGKSSGAADYIYDPKTRSLKPAPAE